MIFCFFLGILQSHFWNLPLKYKSIKLCLNQKSHLEKKNLLLKVTVTGWWGGVNVLPPDGISVKVHHKRLQGGEHIIYWSRQDGHNHPGIKEQAKERAHQTLLETGYLKREPLDSA